VDPVADPERATCSHCGALISCDDRTGLCPRCAYPDTSGSQDEGLSVLGSRVETLLDRCADLHGRGELEEAISAYREVIRIAPQSIHAHYGLGGALTAVGRREEAIAAYRAAIRLEPDFVAYVL
jgi:tetratricopeptide (TPR) repeat protein